MIYLQLFWEFFKTGLFAAGGGMATVPFLFSICERTGWFTMSELANMIAVSESTPGPIGVNMATYVGFTTGSVHLGVFGAVLGGVIATLGLITPSFVIILIIARLLEQFNDKPVVKTVFKYLRPAVIALLIYAFYKIAVLTLFGGGSILIAPAIAFVVLLCCMVVFKKVHPVVWIAVGAVFGLVFL